MSPIGQVNNEGDENPENNESKATPETEALPESSENISNVTPTSENTQEWDGVSLDDDVEDSTEANAQATVDKRRTLGIVGVAAAVLIAGGATFWGVQANSHATVPTAISEAGVDSDDNQICAPFVDVSLECDVEWESSPTAHRGVLLDQSVESGEKVDKGSKVVLTYSNGPISSEMPNLKNKTLDEAEAALYKMNVTVKEIKEVPGQGLEKGHIVATSVAPTTTVENGSEIVLEVSSGKVTIPDWSGKTQEFVEADASKLGIEVTYKTEESEKASGLVISQTPAAGEVVAATKVEVVVSKAFESKDIKVPDVIGKPSDQAQSELAAAGFRQIKTVVVKNSEVTSPQVTQVVPGVGTTGKSEDNIVLIVSEPNK